MKRVLIVNADDCNLTSGVTQAILEGHDRGIVSSTTFLVNLAVEQKTVTAIRRRKKLGVGLHLNITLGRPVSTPGQVRSLIGKDRNFLKVGAALCGRPRNRHLGGHPGPPLRNSREIAVEYQNQILRFQKIFGRRPTHLDTHHQVHNHPLFFRVLAQVARRNRLPIRRSTQHLIARHPERSEGSRDPSVASRPQDDAVKTTDYLFGNLSPEGYWRPGPLEAILENLPEGISEVMCHPGKNDSDLAAISSFTAGRAAEWRLFRLPALRKLLREKGILLSHFGLCYT